MEDAVLLTGPERRRRTDFEDRARILADSFAPDALVFQRARVSPVGSTDLT